MNRTIPKSIGITLLIMGLFGSLPGCSKQEASRKDTFPKDENGDVLRNMEASGDDLSKPRDIDFAFVFAVEPKAREFAERVRTVHGLKAEASGYEERKMWQTTVTKHMVPTHEDITALEQTLTHLAQSHNGKADGWGCLQVDKK